MERLKSFAQCVVRLAKRALEDQIRSTGSLEEDWYAVIKLVLKSQAEVSPS